MKKLIQRVKAKSIPGALFPLAVIIGLIILTLYLVKINTSASAFRIIRIKGVEAAANYPLTLTDAAFVVSNKDSVCTIPVKSNDLITLGDYLFEANDKLGDSIIINKLTDSCLIINGEMNAIKIGEDSGTLGFVNSLQDDKIQQIKSVLFSSPVRRGFIPFLNKLSKLNPKVSLFFEENEDDLLNVYPIKENLFNPAIVFISIHSNDIDKLPGWTNLHTLYLEIHDSLINKPLPAFPQLKMLGLINNEHSAISTNFLKNNPQIESIFVSGNVEDYNFLHELTVIKELSISNVGELTEAQIQKIGPSLSVLTTGSSPNDFSKLVQLKALKWLNILGNINQQAFDSTLPHLKKLQILQFDGDSVMNLKSLKKLGKLRALIIGDTLADKQTIKTFTQLKYLSIPSGNYKDSIYVATLQNSLPGTIITPNSGACLGSGWIILLIPMLISCYIAYAAWNKITGRKNNQALKA